MLVGGRRCVVRSCDSCTHGGVYDGDKSIAVGKLSTFLLSHISPKFIRRFSVRILYAASHGTICHQLMQAHAAEVLCTFGWLFHDFTHSHQQSISGGIAVTVLFICHYLHAGAERLAFSLELIQDSSSYLVDGGAVFDVLIRFHLESAANCIDFRASLTLDFCCASGWNGRSCRCCGWCGWRCSSLLSSTFWCCGWCGWIVFVSHTFFLSFWILISSGSNVSVCRDWLKGYFQRLPSYRYITGSCKSSITGCLSSPHFFVGIYDISNGNSL